MTLYHLLLPFSGQLLVVAWGAYCPGAADRYLGGLAAMTGRHDEIDERFSAALKLEGGMRTAALTAKSRVWWARALAERRQAGDIERARALLEEASSAATPLGLVTLAKEAAEIWQKL
jgi:hypothetical protein